MRITLGNANNGPLAVISIFVWHPEVGVAGLAPFRLTHSLCGQGRRIVKRSLVVDWAEPACERMPT
jgi:hypothetical protein